MTSKTTETPPPAQPPTVPGPRPLTLHMAVQTSTLLSSLAALTGSNGALPILRPGLQARRNDLQKALDGVPPEAFYQAVTRESRARLERFTEGVRKYRRAPRTARPAAPPAVWSEGSSRLLDYGAAPEAARPAKGQEPPVVLVVPSLINRYWVLDLDTEQSLLRDMAARGLRPLVVDWGEPAGDERAFTLTDYIDGRLARALDFAVGLNGGPVALAGYCMGGTLSLALAQRRPKNVRALALLAAPWDFHLGDMGMIRLLGSMMPRVEASVAQGGVLGVDMMQSMFATLDPYLTPRKFQRYATMDPAGAEARRFVQLEDWLNDGVVLAGPVALECFRDWQLANAPARGEWRIAGEPVRPADVSCRSLVVVGERDHLVPPASSRALSTLLTQSETLSVETGHIGLVTGGRARREMFPRLADWLLAP